MFKMSVRDGEASGGWQEMRGERENDREREREREREKDGEREGGLGGAS